MKSSDVVVGMGLLALCVGSTIIGAAWSPPQILMTVAGMAALILTVLAIRHRHAAGSASKTQSAPAASSARSMSYVWLWGALVLASIYAFILPPWREWWHFALAFALGGGLCLFFSTVHARDAESGRDDETMLKLGRYLAMGQLAGTVLTMAGLLIDPNKTFVDTNDPSWAANIIFFAGAAALATISAHALMSETNSKS